MQFLLKHSTIYIIGFMLFFALAIMGKIFWNWYIFSLFIFLGIIWIIVYFPLIIWLTYKKILEYLVASREIIQQRENREQNIKNLAVKIAEEQFGLPEFITKRIVRRINVDTISKYVNDTTGNLKQQAIKINERIKLKK